MRKTKEEARKTRKEIIESAVNLFETVGFEKTTMEAIAREAGVTRGAIYWHFKNKVEVLESIISGYGEGLEQLKKAALQAGKTPLGKLENLVFAVVDNFFDNEGFRQFIKITWYKLSSDEFERRTEMKSTFVQNFLELMQELIQEAVVAEELKADIDPALEAYHLSCLINGFYRVYLVSPRHGQEKEKTIQLFQTTINQMKNHK